MKVICQYLTGVRIHQRLKFSAAAGVMLGGLILFAFPMTSQATEEPDFKIVQKLEDIEIREYATYSVAEVVVPGSAAEAGNQAFPILAGYIFGKNKGERKLAMTAPVTQAPEPVKLDMTAPVTQTTAPGGFRVQFVLPKGVTAMSAPEPLDARVMRATSRQLAWRSFAIRGSGQMPTTTSTWKNCRPYCALPDGSGKAKPCIPATTLPSHLGSCGEMKSGCTYQTRRERTRQGGAGAAATVGHDCSKAAPVCNHGAD